MKQLENPEYLVAAHRPASAGRPAERGSACGPLVRLLRPALRPTAVARALDARRPAQARPGAGREGALGDAEPGVRENAIRSWPRARLAAEPALRKRCSRWRAIRIRGCNFSFCARLGGIDTPASRAAQERLLAQNIEDPWMQIAALTASSDRAPQLFKAAADSRTETRLRGQLLPPGRVRNRSAAKARGDPRRCWRRWSHTSRPGASWWRAASSGRTGQGSGRRSAGEVGRGGRSTIRENVGQDLCCNCSRVRTKPSAGRRCASFATAGLPPECGECA